MNSYFEEIESRLIRDVISTNENAIKQHDVNRNRVNYGCCIAWAEVLSDMGHKVELKVYEEDDYLKIARLEIDGKKIIECE